MRYKRYLLDIVMGIVVAQGVAAVPRDVSWEELAQLTNPQAPTPAHILALTQQEIQIAGFIVPLEIGYDMESVSEFMLVPDPLACIHVPPPPPNQMIYVQMPHDIPLDMDLRGIYVRGTLRLASADNALDSHGYELIGTSASEANIEFEDPFDDPFDDLMLEALW